MLCSDTTQPLLLIYTFISYFNLSLVCRDTYFGCYIWTTSKVKDNPKCVTKTDVAIVRWVESWVGSKQTGNRVRTGWYYCSYFNRTSEKVMFWVSKLIYIRHQIFQCLNPRVTRCQHCDKLITLFLRHSLLLFLYIYQKD